MGEEAGEIRFKETYTQVDTVLHTAPSTGTTSVQQTNTYTTLCRWHCHLRQSVDQTFSRDVELMTLFLSFCLFSQHNGSQVLRKNIIWEAVQFSKWVLKDRYGRDGSRLPFTRCQCAIFTFRPIEQVNEQTHLYLCKYLPIYFLDRRRTAQIFTFPPQLTQLVLC